jgi:hypothetical protein
MFKALPGARSGWTTAARCVLVALLDGFDL